MSRKRSVWKSIGSFFRKTSQFAGVAISQGMRAVWSEERYDTYAKEAFLKNVIAYRCITLIAESVASIPWYIYRQTASGKLQEVDSHPLQAIFRRANPYETWRFFLERTAAFHTLDGNAFVEKVGLTTGRETGKVRELYSHRPDRIVKIKVNSQGLLEGYEFSGPGGSRTISIDPITQRGDMMHIKSFNPTNDWWGSGPTKPAARDIDTDNEQTEWNMRLLQNNARPGLMLMFKGSLGDEQFKHINEMLNEKYAGAMNAGKSLVLEGITDGAEAKPYGFSPSDLDYIEGGREKARRICLAYGVPPQLLGIPGDNTYSNYEQARLAFCEDTVIPRTMRYCEEFGWFLLGNDSNLTFVPDLDKIPALMPRRKELWAMLNENDSLTINEKREAMGYDSVEGGDIILVSAADVPLEMAGQDLTNNTDGGNPKIGEEDDLDEETDGQE